MVKTRNFNRASSKLKRFSSDLENKVPERVYSRANKIAITVRDYIIAHDTVAHGILLEGIDANIRKKSFGYRIKVVSDAPYSGYVEFGTGAYAEPMSPMYSAPEFSHALVHALLEWMMVKPTFRGKPGFYAALKVAEAISNGTEDSPPGTKAQPFMRPAWDDHWYLVRSDVKSEVNKAIRRMTIGF